MCITISYFYVYETSAKDSAIINKSFPTSSSTCNGYTNVHIAARLNGKKRSHYMKKKKCFRRSTPNTYLKIYIFCTHTHSYIHLEFFFIDNNEIKKKLCVKIYLTKKSTIRIYLWWLMVYDATLYRLAVL